METLVNRVAVLVGLLSVLALGFDLGRSQSAAPIPTASTAHLFR